MNPSSLHSLTCCSLKLVFGCQAGPLSWSVGPEPLAKDEFIAENIRHTLTEPPVTCHGDGLIQDKQELICQNKAANLPVQTCKGHGKTQ